MELPINYQRLEAALQPPSTYKDEWHERYHQHQKQLETVAKKLARESGVNFVECPCGERFRVQ